MTKTKERGGFTATEIVPTEISPRGFGWAVRKDNGESVHIPPSLVQQAGLTQDSYGETYYAALKPSQPGGSAGERVVFWLDKNGEKVRSPRLDTKSLDPAFEPTADHILRGHSALLDAIDALGDLQASLRDLEKHLAPLAKIAKQKKD